MESSPLLHIPASVSSRHRLVTIEPVQFLFSLYFAGSMPLTGQFVRSHLAKRYHLLISGSDCGVTNNRSHTDDRVQAEASEWLIYMNVAALVCIFCTPWYCGMFV